MFGLFKRKPTQEEVIDNLFDQAKKALDVGKMFTMRLRNVNKPFKEVIEIQFYGGAVASEGWQYVLDHPGVKLTPVSREDMAQHIESLGFLISDVIFHPKLNGFIPETLMAMRFEGYDCRYAFSHGNALIYINLEAKP